MAQNQTTTAVVRDRSQWLPKHNNYPISHFYSEQFSEQIKNRRFKVGIYRSSFLLKNLQDAETPDALMHSLLAHLIDEADFNSGGFPEKFSVIIRSQVLHQPIQIPYRDFHQNTPDVIMEMFETVEQSGMSKHGRPSLFSAPIHIEVVMGPGNDEVLALINSVTHKGSGPARNVVHNINRSALIEIPYIPDERQQNICLFMAIELSKRYACMRTGDRSAHKAFERLVNGTSAYFVQERWKMVNDLISAIRDCLHVNLTPDLPVYSVEEHVPLVQRYFDSEFPQTYRIVVFGQYGRYKPLWKGARKARYDVPIFLENSHFIAIRRLSAFFGVRYYCVCCESPYGRNSKHKASCNSLCIRCWGKGFEFPCPETPNYLHECANCLINFYNPRCFERHLEAGMCEKRRKCPLCGLVYLMEGGELHLCYYQYCNECEVQHPISEECHVQKIVPKPTKNKPYLIVVYDFECTTHIPVCGHPIDSSANEDANDGEQQQFADLGEASRENSRVDDDDEISPIYDHHVNCVSAYLMCSACVRRDEWYSSTTDPCKFCGLDFTQPRMRTWIVEVDVVTGELTDPLGEFLQWILHGLSGGVNRKLKTLAFAHYSGRYDIHLIAGAIYRLGGLSPRIIRAGNKIYELALERRRSICPEVIFRDTYNWIGMGLAEIPRTLELGDEFNKPFFPHGYNRNENLDVHLDSLPPCGDYFPEAMKRHKREQFETWYMENQHRSFCLRDELRIYCENDVMLLTHALVRFQELFRSLAPRPELEDDVVEKSLTIASACIRHFCINHLIPRQIAIMPDLGYHKRDNQSSKGLKFLRWYAHHHGLQVQHRDSGPEGEYRLRIAATGEQFRLDGYVRRQPAHPDICLEFNGCAWHGHSCYYEPDDISLNGKTSQMNMDEVERRRRLIEAEGLECRFFWECEVEEMMREDKEMASYIGNMRDSSILVPRDALYGGRTGPLALKCDFQDMDGVPQGEELAGEFEILYYDIVSLYPAMNFHTEYPLGHPEVFVLDQEVDWRQPGEHPHQCPSNTCPTQAFRGLLKVFIVAPSDLYLPVVPQRVRGKLVFALCNACAWSGSELEEPSDEPWRKKPRVSRNPLYTKSGVLRDPYTPELGRKLCPHLGDDETRGWVTTITDIELNLALRHGYRVTYVYNVYHWKEWSVELFRPYVREFMRMKIHASGWPDEVQCPENPAEEERRKREFIDRNRAEYGIDLDADEVRKNPGLRYLSKLCLNSMWGRWSLRNNLTKDLITDSPIELHKVLNDPKLELGAVQMLTQKLASVPYKKKRDFVKSGKRHNVMLAVVTTAAARASLYGYMNSIHQSPNCKLLYTDTDSAIFMHRRGTPLPFEAGSMLGQMDKEHPGKRIISFYCGGCKQYLLEIIDDSNGVEENVLRCRGCTLDGANEDVFNSQNFKRMVNNFGKCNPLVMTASRFRPNFRRGEVQTHLIRTTYQPVFDKAHIDAHLDTYPYGYTGEPVRFITNNKRITIDE